MTESRGTFETYPYNPDGPSRPAPTDPPAAGLAPRAVPRGPSATPPPPRDGVGRRLVLGFGVAVGAAVALGLAFNSAEPGYDPESDAEASPAPDEWDEPPEEEPTTAYLELGDDETASFDVPSTWTIDSEGDYLVISHPSGRLVARAPEWSRAVRTDASREADYLREGFDPDGAPTITDESTTYLTVTHQLGEGHFAGEPATEELVLILNDETQRAIAIWWATVAAEKQVTVEARTMAGQLRQQAGAA